MVTSGRLLLKDSQSIKQFSHLVNRVKVNFHSEIIDLIGLLSYTNYTLRHQLNPVGAQYSIEGYSIVILLVTLSCFTALSPFQPTQMSFAVSQDPIGGTTSSSTISSPGSVANVAPASPVNQKGDTTGKEARTNAPRVNVANVAPASPVNQKADVILVGVKNSDSRTDVQPQHQVYIPLPHSQG
jgi:hypothetical protein